MKILQNLRSVFSAPVFSLLERYRIVILHYNVSGKKQIFDRVYKVRQERKMLSLPIEAMQIYLLSKATQKIGGDMAEVGVFQGSTAKIMCLTKGRKTLHLFDTFEGLPTPVSSDDPILKKGMFPSSLESVKLYLSKYKNVKYYKGIFPSTAKHIRNLRFSFVNLDTDLYEGTYQSLEFFYPRMNKGGIIITHDYAIYGGVRKAFDSFFEDKPDPIIELAGTEGMIVKCS